MGSEVHRWNAHVPISSEQLIYDIQLLRDKLVTLRDSRGNDVQHLLKIYDTEKPASCHSPLLDETCTALPPCYHLAQI